MFPTPWSVTVHEHSYGERDEYGERADVWTDREEPVYGWAPPSADTEPFEQGRRTSIADIDVYGPPGLTITSLDEVTIPVGPAADRYMVDSFEDYGFGPFNYRPGVRVSLRRVKDEG